MSTAALADDPSVVRRILEHIDAKSTDLSETIWREPVANYRCPSRFAAELELLRGFPSAFCPSAALAEPGSYVAREAVGTPLVAVRGMDGRVRAFRNACRHRGTQLVDGSGCQKGFVCPYHGWAYALDGSLRNVPHEHGFPGLDKSERGLVPVETTEAGGVVFVSQNKPLADAGLNELPSLIDSSFRFMGENAIEIEANWKIVVEGFLEGYHIRSTHPQSFYPLQYDNINVLETFGRNARIAFPFRAIEKLRGVPDEQCSTDGKLTYVYHLFPNGMIATFPGRIFMVAVEPLSIDRTRLVTYVTTNRSATDAGAQDKLQRGTMLVAAGATEDREVQIGVQKGLASGANEFFEFGLFEGGLAHFHRTLGELVGEAAGS